MEEPRDSSEARAEQADRIRQPRWQPLSTRPVDERPALLTSQRARLKIGFTVSSMSLTALRRSR